MTKNASYQEAVKLAQTGQLEPAEEMCRRLLKDAPNNYNFLYLLASIHLLQRCYEESRKLCHRLLEMNDRNADVYNLLGAISADHDKNDVETEKWLRRALACDPGNPKVLVNLGNLSFFKGALEEAQSLFARATTPQLPNADAIGGLAMIATRIGDYELAIDLNMQALALDPTATAVLSNLISGLYKVKRKEEATHYAQIAAALPQPRHAAVPALCVAKNHGLFDEVNKLLPLALHELALLPNDSTLFSFASLAMLSAAPLTNEMVFEVHHQAAEVIRRGLKHAPYTDHPVSDVLHAPIKIAYVSSDLNRHVLGHFFMGILEFRNRQRFEVYLYSDMPKEMEDSMTEQYRAAVDHFVCVYGMDDEAVAKRMHDDGIHILVDLNGHVGTGASPRLAVLAYQPAPVQMAYLGYPYSYGLKEVDYVISDPWLNGKDNARFCDETPLEMPSSFITIGDYLEREITPEPAYQRKGHVTFGSLGNVYKLNDKTILLWSRILTTLPASRLYLNHPGYGMACTRASVIQEFARHGIADDRITMVWDQYPSGMHLPFYNEMDISLDTLPLTGGTTTVDSLWMGVPVVTLVGQTHAQRLSYSIINNVGVNMDDCIAFTEDAYVEKAVGLAQNMSRIEALRSKIPTAMRSSILCNPARFTREMENLYLEAWNRKFPNNNTGDAVNTINTIAVPIVGTTCRVVVDADDNNLFSYVLREQQQWFESETNFLVSVAATFTQFWDFSNDPGVYAIPVASRQVESGGVTVAIRSDEDMSGLILQSVAENKLSNVVVTAEPDPQQPLPDLVRFSLDYNDGEGNLLQPWLEKFDEASPLVLASLRNQEGADLSAMPALAEKGYQSYRLLPGYGILVPHRFGDPMYASDINLFFCKADRAQALSDAGLLCLAATSVDSLPTAQDMAWVQLLEKSPYTSAYLQSWVDQPVESEWGQMYLTALNVYAEARDVTRSPAQRYARVQILQTIMMPLIQNEATAARLLSGIRIMRDIGNRELAVQWAGILVAGLQGMSGVLFDEPFLMPEEIWEGAVVSSSEVEWASALARVSQERLSRFSSWFTGDQSLAFWQECGETYPWLSELSQRMVGLMTRRYRDDDHEGDTTLSDKVVH